jgi:hypothetical protein
MDKTEIGFRHIHWKSVEMPVAIVASILFSALSTTFTPGCFSMLFGKLFGVSPGKFYKDLRSGP